MKTFACTAFLALLLPIASARAADKDATLKTLRPYIDNQTAIVVHIDTTKIDIAAIEKFMRNIIAIAKVNNADELIGYFNKRLFGIINPLASFTRIGGRDIFIVSSLDDAMKGNWPPVLLIPLEAGVDAKTMSDFLTSQGGPNSVFPAGDNVLVIGDAKRVQKLHATKAAARPDMEAAISAAPPVAVQFILAPSDEGRKTIAGMMPQLPDAAGTGDTEGLAKGLKSIIVSVDLPPAAAADVRIDCAGPDAAHQISDLLAKLITLGRESPPITNLAAQAQTDPAMKPVATAAGKMFDDLAPKIDGSAIVVKLTIDQFNEIAPVIKPSMERAVVLNRKVVSAANLRGISLSCIVWANENGDAMPDHVGRLLVDRHISPKQLAIPGSGTEPLELTPEMLQKAKTDFASFAAEVDKHCDYIYLGKGTTNTTDSSVALAYEKTTATSKEGLVVTFMDAHAEFVKWGQVPEVFKLTNEYLKKMNLPEVDVDALMKAAPKDK